MPAFRNAVLTLIILAGLLAAACDPEMSGIPSQDRPNATVSGQPVSPGPSLPTAEPSPLQDAAPTQPLANVSTNNAGKSLVPTATPGPDIPTPYPSNTGWVRERLDAVIGLYELTDEGAALLRSLDLRQMRSEPGFFGSYGFHGWAGVGEAKPIPVMHELSHSY